MTPSSTSGPSLRVVSSWGLYQVRECCSSSQHGRELAKGKGHILRVRTPLGGKKKRPQKEKGYKTGSVAEVVKPLPSIQETLGLIPSTAEKAGREWEILEIQVRELKFLDPSHPNTLMPPLYPPLGENSSASFCLDGVWAQGERLDIDRALSRSQDVWTHTCPQSSGNGTDTFH